MRTTILVAVAAAIPAALAGQTTQAAQACTHRGTAEAIAQRPSPLDSVQVTTNGYTLKVCYGRPYAKARLIMGGLVPFGQPWRLGANEPTRLFLPFAAEVAGVRVEPGEYSLYVVPQQASWEVHVNKSVERWGIPIDDKVQAQDVGKGTVAVETLAQPVEQLALSLVADADGTALVVEWEKTRVRIPIRKVS
ncbi:MAG: DUF2911 domain-containing protein [Gemmatimonadales bacterium]|jgi:hypothetical protein